MTRSVSTNLRAHLAQPYQTMATCWRVQLTNGTIKQFTSHDANIVINGWTGTLSPLNGTYLAATGYTPSDISTGNALQVDNMEVAGMLSSPSITEADLHAGVWDFAQITIFQVNYNDLTQATGVLYERTGTIGQVTLEQNQFKAELRGLTQYYSRVIGQLFSPSCRAILGDARCTVNLTPYTVTGTVASINTDTLTIYDPARTEPGPTGGVAISNVSNGNPGVVTIADNSLNLYNAQPITISGVVGPSLINLVTLALSPDHGTPGHFNLGIDTSNTLVYPPYVSGGTVTPLGQTSGYFDNGVITWTSGLNVGLRMEVKSYVPGQITLSLNMPYTVAPGDTYSMTAGCDHALATCRDKFSNLTNFRGEPYLPGVDKLVQVGRSQ